MVNKTGAIETQLLQDGGRNDKRPMRVHSGSKRGLWGSVMALGTGLSGNRERCDWWSNFMSRHTAAGTLGVARRELVPNWIAEHCDKPALIRFMGYRAGSKTWTVHRIRNHNSFLLNFVSGERRVITIFMLSLNQHFRVFRLLQNSDCSILGFQLRLYVLKCVWLWLIWLCFLMFIQSLSLFHCSPSFQYVAVVFFHGTSDHSERLFIEPFIFLSVRACMSACVCVYLFYAGVLVLIFSIALHFYF